MFARIALPASRLAVRAALPRASALAGRPSLAGVLASSSRSSTLSPSSFLSARFYAGGADAPDASLTKANIETRILDIFKTFDKVKQDKLSLDASFTEDLGLDSLDAVEVIMAIEEDFFIEIPDAEADEIRTVRQAVDYILRTPEAGL